MERDSFRGLRRLIVVLCAMLMLGALPGCDRLPDAWDALPWDGEPRPTPTAALLAQWAIGAAASSHYALPDWSPNRATGAPDVQACADDARAWASARGNGVEWLQLTYAEAVHAVEVRVYQTYGRGAVSRITLIDDGGTSEVVWEGLDEGFPCPGTLAIRLEPTEIPVRVVRIDLDESRTGSWNQIDAVELIGIP